jgi:hypothetical protein
MWRSRSRNKRPDAGTAAGGGGAATAAGSAEEGPITHTGSLHLIVAATAMLMATAVVGYAEQVNDYPTSARAEYVFGCLKANGETRQAIDQCSCSIDVIASLLPYDRYVTAETVLSMSQVRGNLGGQFRTSEQAASAVNDLRRAQAEAEVRCF